MMIWLYGFMGLMIIVGCMLVIWNEEEKNAQL
jgi:hypothetical protein